MTKFSKNSHCDLDLDPITLKRELVRGIVISNTCVKLYRNWIINEVARAGEHTNEVRTYVRTYSHTYVRDRPYIPSTTLLCEGITKDKNWLHRMCKVFKKQVSSFPSANNQLGDQTSRLTGKRYNSYSQEKDFLTP